MFLDSTIHKYKTINIQISQSSCWYKITEMENNKIAVGLDIGTTKIVAMIGRKNEYGKLEVLGIGKAKSLRC